jgi:HrpA-like RNA helicase
MVERLDAPATSGDGRMRVILATNIAESSVTIRGVAHVIDTCRTLQLRWEKYD